MLVNISTDKDFQRISWYLNREEISPSKTDNIVITNTILLPSERLKKEFN